MFRIVLAFAFSLLAGLSLAQEWSVSRARGTAEYMSSGSWQPVTPGLIIADGSKLRTGGDGRMDIVRGAEVVTLGANTAAELRDGGADLMTSLVQQSGTITADVERRNVQHFSIQTPFLAAVVKGTMFTVTVDGNGAEVTVERGTVQVQDRRSDRLVDIVRGQTARVGSGGSLAVDGDNAPVIYTFDGEAVAKEEVASETPAVPTAPAPVPETPSAPAAPAPQAPGNGPGAAGGPASNSPPAAAPGKAGGPGNGHGPAADPAPAPANGGTGNNGNGNGPGNNNGNGNGNSGPGNNNGNGNANSGPGNHNGHGHGNSGPGNNNGNGNLVEDVVKGVGKKLNKLLNR